MLCLDEAETLVDIIDILAAALKASSDAARYDWTLWHLNIYRMFEKYCPVRRLGEFSDH